MGQREPSHRTMRKSAVLWLFPGFRVAPHKDKATAAGYLNKILSNSDITKADIAGIGTVYGIDASAVADSQGALRVSKRQRRL